MEIKGKEVKQLVCRLDIEDHDEIKILMAEAQRKKLTTKDGDRYILHTFGAELIMLGYEVKKIQMEYLKKNS